MMSDLVVRFVNGKEKRETERCLSGGSDEKIWAFLFLSYFYGNFDHVFTCGRVGRLSAR